MIIIKEIVNPFDGRLLTHHKIIDCIISEKMGDVTFVVGSWVSQEEEGEKPSLKTNLTVYYDQWSFEYYNSGAETVMAHPDWHGNGPKRPVATHIWNPLTFGWVPPSEIPLADLKLEKWDQIKYSRNLNEFGGFEWNGNRFNSSQISTIRINGQAQAAIVAKMTESPFSVTWTLSNNKSIELTANEMISISMALATHVNFCHNRSTVLRAQLELAESRQQISEVNW